MEFICTICGGHDITSDALEGVKWDWEEDYREYRQLADSYVCLFCKMKGR